MVDEGDNCKKDLRLIGNKFHGRGKELQTERPENLSMQVRCGSETQMVR